MAAQGVPKRSPSRLQAAVATSPRKGTLFDEKATGMRRLVVGNNKFPEIDITVDMHGLTRITAASLACRIIKNCDQCRVNKVRFNVGLGKHSTRAEQDEVHTLRDVTEAMVRSINLEGRRRDEKRRMVRDLGNEWDEALGDDGREEPRKELLSKMVGCLWRDWHRELGRKWAERLDTDFIALKGVDVVKAVDSSRDSAFMEYRIGNQSFTRTTRNAVNPSAGTLAMKRAKIGKEPCDSARELKRMYGARREDPLDAPNVNFV